MQLCPNLVRNFFPRLLLLILLPMASQAQDAAPSNELQGDDRPDIDATFFIGSAIDNFAADEVNRYLNPEASGDVQTFERLTAGITFGARLHDWNDGKRQLWVYGGTVHGVRSSDVDCVEDSTLPVCQSFENETDPDGRFLFILRNASSLEAHLGLRYEFLPLSNNKTQLYVNAQAGLLTVSSSGNDVIDQHHLGLGIVAKSGRFTNSYLEIGYGKNDLFELNSDKRWKANGLVDWKLTKTTRAFAKMTVDVDLDDGSDSIQTYLGLRLDLGKLFKKADPTPAQAPSNTSSQSETPSGTT